MDPEIIKKFKPDQPTPEPEPIKPSARLIEIDKELTAKRTRMEEIKQRTPDPEFSTEEEVTEMTELVEKITSLEKERTRISSV
jgi:hypothetical protein